MSLFYNKIFNSSFTTDAFTSTSPLAHIAGLNWQHGMVDGILRLTDATYFFLFASHAQTGSNHRGSAGG